MFSRLPARAGSKPKVMLSDFGGEYTGYSLIGGTLRTYRYERTTDGEMRRAQSTYAHVPIWWADDDPPDWAIAIMQEEIRDRRRKSSWKSIIRPSNTRTMVLWAFGGIVPIIVAALIRLATL